MAEDVSARREIPWARIGAEGIAVVLSILLAFAIDAAWDARAEKQHERAVLESLFADFQSNRERGVEIAGAHERSRSAALELLAALDGAAPRPEPARFDSLLRVSLRDGWSLNLTNGALDALLASGRFELIQSELDA